MYRRVLPLLLTAILLLSGCTAGQKNMLQKTDEKERTGQPSDMSGEGSMYMDTMENVIYLAGGCFWGMEQLMQSIPGVTDAESGYANGTCETDADYKTVCKGETGFREAVRGRSEKFFVEIGPLKNYYPAEEYHQNYLEKESKSGFDFAAVSSHSKVVNANRMRLQILIAGVSFLLSKTRNVRLTVPIRYGI